MQDQDCQPVEVSDDTQLGIALRRIAAENEPVDPQAPVASFNSAFS